MTSAAWMVLFRSELKVMFPFFRLAFRSSSRPGLVNRDFAPRDLLDLFGDLVGADHRMAEFGQADGRDQADVSRSDDGDFHEGLLFSRYQAIVISRPRRKSYPGRIAQPLSRFADVRRRNAGCPPGGSGA